MKKEERGKKKAHEENSLETGVEEVVVELEGLLARRTGFGESVEEAEVGGL